MMDLTKSPAQLKASILQDAMMGKLTQQLPEDGDAKDLLTQIDAEKDALIKAKKIKKQKALPEIKDDEIPFEIPDNWQWVRLGDICTLLNGRAYKQRELLNDSSFTPVLRVGNMFTNNSWYYSDLDLPDDKYVDDGDIIYSWSASFGPAIWTGPRVIYHYHIWKVIPHGMDKKFLYYLLLYLTQSAKSNSHGTSMKHLTKSKMESMLVPVAPILEQKKTAKKLDSLLPKIDEFNNSVEKINNLREELPSRLSRSFLQSAMMGKLTKQLPEDGDASELLDQIKVEKEALIKAKKIKKQKPLPEIDADEIPFEIPDNWQWVRLNDIGTWKSGSTPKRSHPEYYGGSINWLKTGDLNDSYINKTSEKITQEGVKDSNLTINPPGSVLIAMYGATIAKLGILNVGATTNQACCACKTYSDINNKFLFYYLMSQRNNFIALGAGGAQPNISRTKIINYLIPLPPLPEQKRIVNKLDKLLDELKG